MKKHSLPNRLRPFFWDYDFNVLTWAKDRDLVIKRILTLGDWDAIDWLRSHAIVLQEVLDFVSTGFGFYYRTYFFGEQKNAVIEN